MDTLETIKSRRSVRLFNHLPIEKSDVFKIIESGIMAPSGKNGQPWRFVIVQEDRKLLENIAELSIYKNWLKNADCFIVVLIDKLSSYHYIKDVQAIGGCIQNMLLSAHEMGIGSCWNGEIYKDGDTIKSLLSVTDENLELMAIVALGYSSTIKTEFTRKKTEDVLIKHL